MKIKIIDLLNKIANKEELPKEIIYDNWHWHLQLGTYMNHIVGKSLFGGYLIGYELLEKLNDEIKISGQPENIDKIKECKFNIKDVFEELNNVQVSQFTYGIVDKINEIIDYINKGDNNETEVE